MTDPGMTIDQRGIRTSGGRLRTYLPDELVARFEPLYNLNVSAGQADLVVARDRSSGDEVVVKLYRNAEQLDREVMERLYRADIGHVVRLIDHGETDGELWEVQEYCALGTLTDYRLEHGDRLSEPLVRAAVMELAAAIHHIHTLNITHRDLKPENVLVRSLDPLDLVLTDFGVAVEQIATVQLQTVAASWVWAAPEVHTKGAVSRDIDWWAMGAIVHQLLTGRHPLALGDGRLPSDLKLIRAGVVDGLYSTEEVSDQRWRNLVDGLLSYEPTARWGYAQVIAWLDGEDPEVVRTTPISEQLRAAKNAPPEETREHMFIWNGEPIRTGLELVQAMRANWHQATEFLTRWPDKALRAWLLTRPDGQVLAQVMDLEVNGAGRLIRLQARFDPQGSLEFQGLAVTDESLNNAIRAADRRSTESMSNGAAAHEWLSALRDQHILKSIAAAVETDSARLIRADLLLNDWRDAASGLLSAATNGITIAQSTQCADAAARGFEDSLSLQFSAAMSGSIPSRISKRSWIAASEVQRTMDALAKHELLPKASPWAEGQKAHDTLIGLVAQVADAPKENLGLHIPASIYLEMIGQVCLQDLDTLRDEAARIKHERRERERAKREARERAEREARERAERETRLAAERAEAEKRRLEESTKKARLAAKQWWEERLVIEQSAMQATEDKRVEDAIGRKRKEIERLTSTYQRAKSEDVNGGLLAFWLVLSAGAIAALIYAINTWGSGAVTFAFIASAFFWGGLFWMFYPLLGVLMEVSKGSSAKKTYNAAKEPIEVEIARLKPKQIRLVRIPANKVGAVIGKGGESIRSITASGVTVDIQGWHEVAPLSQPRSAITYNRSAVNEPPAIRIEKDEWEADTVRERPWLRPRRAPSDWVSYIRKSGYWKYVDKDFLSKDSRARYGSYSDDDYATTDDDQWYSDSDAYQDNQEFDESDEFDDFGGLITSSMYGGTATASSHDYWDWFEEPATLPPAPTPPTKTVRGEERRKWKLAYKDAVEDYKHIRHEYERIFRGPRKGHGGVVVAVVTAESAAAANRAVSAIHAAMAATRPAPGGGGEVARNSHAIVAGQEFSGPVKNITEYGAFVELAPGVDGLLHISELRSLNGNKRVDRVSDVLRIGQIVKVKVHQVKPGNKYSLKLVH